MGDRVQKLVVEGSFVNGTYRHPGEVVIVDTDQLNGKETNLADLTGDGRPAFVPTAPIGPTGPDPKSPQQIAPDARQTFAGYQQAGAEVVAATTPRSNERFANQPEADDTAQGDLAEQLRREREVSAALRAEIDRTRARRGDVDEVTREAVAADVTANSDQGDDDDGGEQTAAEIIESLGAKTDDELADLRKAEVNRSRPRSTVIKAIDAELKNRQS